MSTTAVHPAPTRPPVTHREGKHLRISLIVVAVVFLSVFILLPAANVFAQALSNGMKAFDSSVKGPGDLKGFNLQVATSDQMTDPAQFRQQTNTMIFKRPLPPTGIGSRV